MQEKSNRTGKLLNLFLGTFILVMVFLLGMTASQFGMNLLMEDYDLRNNNVNWNVTEDVYSVLDSEKYKRCSAFCMENFRR